MPLDRRIAIEVDRGGFDGRGEYVPAWQYLDGTAVPDPLPDPPRTDTWAERRSEGSVDLETAGGLRTVESVAWTVRYAAAIAALDIARLRVRDADGDVWNPTGIGESDRRRRFIDISATRVAT